MTELHRLSETLRGCVRFVRSVLQSDFATAPDGLAVWLLPFKLERIGADLRSIDGDPSAIQPHIDALATALTLRGSDGVCVHDKRYLTWHEAALAIVHGFYFDACFAADPWDALGVKTHAFFAEHIDAVVNWLSGQPETDWEEIDIGVRREQIIYASGVASGPELPAGPVAVVLRDDALKDGDFENVLSATQQDLAAGGDDDDQDAAHGGMTWQVVAERLERLRASGEEYTNRRDFAERFSCSLPVIQRAVAETPSLHKWAKFKTASGPKAQELSEVVTDTTVQTREPDPADMVTDDDAQVTMRRLIEQAPPERRAELHQALSGLPPDELRRVLATYADADDLGNRVLGRRP